VGSLVDEGDGVGREELAVGDGVLRRYPMYSTVSPGAASPSESRVWTRDQMERFLARERRCRVSGRPMRTREKSAHPDRLRAPEPVFMMPHHRQSCAGIGVHHAPARTISPFKPQRSSSVCCEWHQGPPAISWLHVDGFYPDRPCRLSRPGAWLH
jgi:hypothetical protein